MIYSIGQTGGRGLESTFSMHQYAIRHLGNGDDSKGLEVFDLYATPIEKWLINQSKRQREREAAAIFIFVASGLMALFASYFSSVLAGPFALIAIIAAVAFCWVRLELTRLVARKDDIKSVPQPFRNAYNGHLGAIAKEAFAGDVKVLNISGNLTSLRREICALDVIWFIESEVATRLKASLQFDQSRFPANISLSTTAVPSAHLNIANFAPEDEKPEDDIPAPTYDANELPKFEKHWLAIHHHRKTQARLNSLKKYLPPDLQWMVLPIEKAFLRCKLNPYIDDKELLDIVWRNLEEDPNWQQGKSAKDKETVRRLIYRDRASGYRWVREYFMDLNRPHKYAPKDQSPKKQPFLPFGSSKDLSD
jgi:hypothetical protein